MPNFEPTPPSRPRRPRVVLPDVVIVSDGTGRAHELMRALRDDARVMVLTRDTFVSMVPQRLKPSAVVIDVRHRTDADAAADLRIVSAVASGAPIVVYATTRQSAQALHSCPASEGCVITICNTIDHPQLVFRHVAQALATQVAIQVSETIDDPLFRDLAFQVISGACSDLTAPRLLASVSMARKRFTRAVARRGFSGAHDLIQWGRVVFGAAMLARRWRLVKQISNDLGWNDDPALGFAVTQRLGCTPQDLFRTGSFEVARDAFLEALTPRPLLSARAG